MQRQRSGGESAEVRQWLRRFAEVQLKELRNEALGPSETSVLAQAAVIGRIAPGLLEESLLSVALESEEEGVYRAAAASSKGPGAIYEAVQEAIREGKTFLEVPLADRSFPLFELDPSGGLVQPKYQNGYTFVIERRGQPPQTVGPYGGVFVAIEDLRQMVLVFEASRKTIRLSEA